jgi:hypothetical protein
VETCVGVGEHLALAAYEPRAVSNAASEDDQRLEKTQASASPPLPVAASEVRPAEKSVGVDEPLALAADEQRAVSNTASEDAQQMEKTQLSARSPLPASACEVRPVENSVGVGEPLALAADEPRDVSNAASEEPEQMEKTPASAHPPLPVAVSEPRPLEKSVALEEAQRMDRVARPNARPVDSGDDRGQPFASSADELRNISTTSSTEPWQTDGVAASTARPEDSMDDHVSACQFDDAESLPNVSRLDAVTGLTAMDPQIREEEKQRRHFVGRSAPVVPQLLPVSFPTDQTQVPSKRNEDRRNVIGTTEHFAHHKNRLAAHVDQMRRNKQPRGHGVAASTRAHKQVTEVLQGVHVKSAADFPDQSTVGVAAKGGVAASATASFFESLAVPVCVAPAHVCPVPVSACKLFPATGNRRKHPPPGRPSEAYRTSAGNDNERTPLKSNLNPRVQQDGCSPLRATVADCDGPNLVPLSPLDLNMTLQPRHMTHIPQNQPPSLVSIAEATEGVFDAMTQYLTGDDKSLFAVAVQQWSGKLLRDVVSFLTERLDESLAHKLSDGDVISVLNMNNKLERLSLSGCTSITGECLASLMGHYQLKCVNLRDFRFKGDEPTAPTPKLEWRNIRSNVMNFITNCGDEHNVVKVIMPSEINIMEDEETINEFTDFIYNTSWPSNIYCSSCNFNWVSCSPFGLAHDEYHDWSPEARTNLLFTQQTVCSACLKPFCNDCPRFHKMRGLREPYPKVGNCNTYFCGHCLESFCSSCCGPDLENPICDNCKIYRRGTEAVDEGASAGRKRRRCTDDGEEECPLGVEKPDDEDEEDEGTMEEHTQGEETCIGALTQITLDCACQTE